MKQALVEVTPRWRTGGVAMVCTKCTEVRYLEDFPEAAGDPRLQVRDWLKERLKREGYWGPVRVLGSSCLDVCAKGGLTVLLDPIGTGEPERCIVVDPMTGREELYAEIVRALHPEGARSATVAAPADVEILESLEQ